MTVEKTDPFEEFEDEGHGTAVPPADAPGLRYHTLGDVLANPALTAPPTPIVGPIAYKGRATLVSAREKMGKSTLLGQIVAGVSNGVSFLEGEAVCRPVITLWYAIDEPLGDAARRLESFGADHDMVILCEGRPTAIDTKAAVARTGAELVVIDTLSELWASELEHERDANSVSKFLRPYVDVARGTGVGIVFLYHTRKVGDEYRGSVALGATVDAVLTLRPVTSPDQSSAETSDEQQADDGRRMLVGRTRWGRVRLDLGFSEGSYSVRAPKLPVRDRALAALRDGTARSASTLAEVLSVRKEVAMHIVADLVKEGLIQRQGKFLVVAAERVNPPTDSTGSAPETIGDADGNRSNDGPSEEDIGRAD